MLMPIFEFICNKCDEQFEYLMLSPADKDPECPKCQGKDVKKLMSAGSVRPHGIPSGSGGFALPKCAQSSGS